MQFKSKLLLLPLFFIIVTVVLFSAITYHYGTIVSQDTIREKIIHTKSIQQRILSQQAQELKLVSLLVSSEPAFITYIAEALNFYTDKKQIEFLTSIADLLQERKQQYTFDFAIIADSDGTQMARSDQVISVVKDLSTNKYLAQSMQELQPVSGYWFENKQLYQMVIVPIAQGQNLVGFLITGNKIDDIYLNSISQLSGTQILAIIEKNNKYSILASSGDVGFTQSIENTLNTIGLQKEKKTENTFFDMKINRNKFIINKNTLTQLENSNIYLLTAVSQKKILAPFIQTRFSLQVTAVLIAIIALIATSLLFKHFIFEIKSLALKIKSIDKKNTNRTLTVRHPEFIDIASNLNQLGDNIYGSASLTKHLVEISKKIPLINDKFCKKASNEISQLNQTIGERYKILRKIGSGGVGTVFQAIDSELNELIALKILIKTENESIQILQLKDEIKFLRRIQNPNVVRIHDFGKTSSHIFVSMEFITGYTIAEVLNFSHKLRPDAAKFAAMQICKGLEATHNEGIIHCDLKPENLIIELDSTVKLMDFGIASTQNHVSKTQQSEVIEGTIAYSSPEQLQGKGADERSDIYALGVIIMEIFCGKRPYKADNEDELMYIKVSEKPYVISDFWASAPILLENIISKCLKIDPNQRYQNVSDVLNDLKKVHL